MVNTVQDPEPPSAEAYVGVVPNGSVNVPVNGNGNGSHKPRGRLAKLLAALGLRPSVTLKESVEEIIEEHEALGETEQEEKLLLQNILIFNELDVEDVMIPRADIMSVDHQVTLEELKKVVTDSAVHTRMPVCRETLDDIVGFLHLKDLLPVLTGDQSFDMGTIMREGLFVPPSMKISALLMKMQVQHVHMAIVVDEFGGTCGLVTLEDVMEKIVGNIEDEHDQQTEDAVTFQQVGEHMYEASGRLPIQELENHLQETFIEENNEDFDTLGGLIFFLLGRVPSKGEIATHENGYEFEIMDADPRKVKRVLIRRAH